MNEQYNPSGREYHPFYAVYINKVVSVDLAATLIEQVNALEHFFAEMSDEEASQPYGEGKWSYKELVGHILDTERIMAFRALCVSREEGLSLPGFDQDSYMQQAEFNQQPLSSLLEDFSVNRQSIINLLRTIPEGTLQNIGHIGGKSMSVRALLKVIPGHFLHHMEIVEKLRMPGVGS